MGEFTGGDVVLMELEKKVEVRVGDAFFFRGECIANKREAVQGVVTTNFTNYFLSGMEPRLATAVECTDSLFTTIVNFFSIVVLTAF